MLNFLIRLEKNNSHYSIGVFSKLSWQQESLFNKLVNKTKNPPEIYLGNKEDMPDFNTPGIKLINYQSAKGLEFDIVFIPDLDTANLNTEIPETLMLLYVLMSRAREELYLSYSGNTEPPLMKLISADLVERIK
jgi:superfamily I DNA/RNA helicase